ncbi:autotransporter outer membrane beta-barrel domain-containing protein [Ralstonia pseudosolanacearum]|uniref:autotransporter outer membrane beta-barrel domain-containing protein n=1 Tax=Ralstonia pseudosolanacearum TaxID=1310165 RepID=UPI003CF52925
MSTRLPRNKAPRLTLLGAATFVTLYAVSTTAASAAPADFATSVHNASLFGQAMQSSVQTFVQGTSRCEVFGTGGYCLSAGSLYTSHAGQERGNNVLGELNVGYRLTSNWVVGVGYQGPSYKLSINGDNAKSNANTFGAYVEYGNRLRQGAFARVALAYQRGHATIDRSYLTGVDAEGSTGSTTIGQQAASAQAGYVLIAGGNMAVMPYLGVDYLKTKIDGYMESGGQRPANFNSRTETNFYGTAGLTGSINLSGKAIITAGLKHAQRLNKHQEPISGDAIDSFSVGQESINHWSEANIGVQVPGPMKASRLSVSYAHRFASGSPVARDVAGVTLSIGF